MITQAEIQSIDYNSNDCIVRIPAFENVSSEFPALTTAKLMCLPGIFNGYLVGDAVWVAFNLDIYAQPVVIGKIYKGIDYESKVDADGVLLNKGGAVNCLDLTVVNSATLPLGTKISTTDTEYNTLEKLINKFKDISLYGTGAEGEAKVEANPAGEARLGLTSIKIDNTIYSLPTGIPTPPTANGTYTLKCTVADGVKTYSWEQDD